MCAFRPRELATFMASLTFLQGTPTSATMASEAFSLFSIFFRVVLILPFRSDFLILLPLKLSCPSFVIMTIRSLGDRVVEFDSASSMLICTVLEVNMKNMSSKKMISVKDDIENSALTLDRFFMRWGLGCRFLE